jgi:hypothetical protein
LIVSICKRLQNGSYSAYIQVSRNFMTTQANEIDKYKVIEKPLKNGNILLWIGIPIVIIAPFILTRSLGLVDFTETGTIGDTIGGLTSPFIGLIGAILVFLALKAQIQANILVQKQIENQENEKKIEIESSQLNKLYENLKSSIDNFSYSTLDTWEFNNQGGKELKGSEAFYKLFQDFYCDAHLNEEDLKTNPKITEVISILEICDTLLDKISKSNVYDKETLETLTLHQFIYRVFPRLSADYPDNLEIHYCESCAKTHGFPSKISSLVMSIKSKCDERVC